MLAPENQSTLSGSLLPARAMCDFLEEWVCRWVNPVGASIEWYATKANGFEKTSWFRSSLPYFYRKPRALEEPRSTESGDSGADDEYRVLFCLAHGTLVYCTGAATEVVRKSSVCMYN